MTVVAFDSQGNPGLLLAIDNRNGKGVVATFEIVRDLEIKCNPLILVREPCRRVDFFV